MKVLSQSLNRFEISNEGWRRMHGGRHPEELIREAISNALDEDNVTEVSVNIKHDAELSTTTVIIEDNSPFGIPDPDLVSTVFLTDKTDQSNKRGRKGRGLKEFLSAARIATVETVGFTVHFDVGRTVYESARAAGTKILGAFDAWYASEVNDAIRYLSRIIPPQHISLSINGNKVQPRKIRKTINEFIETVVISTNGLQSTQYSYNNINIVNLSKGETTGWLYEFGIPIQEIKTKFHIDVQARIPVNDNRTFVPDHYVHALYGICLKELLPSLSRGALIQEWATIGLKYIPYSQHAIIIKKLFGDKELAVKSTNGAANNLAKNAGIKIIDPSNIGSHEIERIVRASVKSVDQVALDIDANNKGTEVPVYMADPGGKASMVAMFVAQEILGINLDVQFISRGAFVNGSMIDAEFDASKAILRINTQADLDLQSPINPKFIAMLCNKLIQDKDNVSDMAGRIACLLFNSHDAMVAALAT